MNAIQNIISDLWESWLFWICIKLMAAASVPIILMSLAMRSLHATVGS